MIVKPKIRGYICTTAHPTGCKKNVHKQIAYVKSRKRIKNGPKNVLIIGASTGYGLASRINAAFGSASSTIGVFLEKESNIEKTGSAGWYNSSSFDKAAKKEGLYSKSINGDAFSDQCRKSVIHLIKKDLKKIDLVIYSLAASVCKLPKSSKIIRAVIKPIGQPYTSVSLDPKRNTLININIEPANKKEIANTIQVMGGQNWQIWINMLNKAGVLSENVKTIAYSYIGNHLTWPIYWHGTIGMAKHDLEKTAKKINKLLQPQGGSAYIAVLKSVVTQASSAIPMMPLYISIVFKVMKEKSVHEGCIEQIQRLFSTQLYTDIVPKVDNKCRFRLDNWELCDEVQNTCHKIWKQINNNININKYVNYQNNYQSEFFRLFGFGIKEIDYAVNVNIEEHFDVINTI
ncbi:Enoyl-[acyl-carrier-protein] reductase [NADH] [Candidatus Ecksteinia adelgidicola]|nr:Enoyl-[acyl-carrier-protein] reductase [NADH] [Candidatus Ecksteinia adelgidicola]